MKTKILTDILNESRRDLAEVLEEMGAVAMHLREAMEAADPLESIPQIQSP